MLVSGQRRSLELIPCFHNACSLLFSDSSSCSCRAFCCSQLPTLGEKILHFKDCKPLRNAQSTECRTATFAGTFTPECDSSEQSGRTELSVLPDVEEAYSQSTSFVEPKGSPTRDPSPIYGFLGSVPSTLPPEARWPRAVKDAGCRIQDAGCKTQVEKGAAEYVRRAAE